MLLGNKPTDYGHILENVVYLELLRRGYKVFVGKNNNSEVDLLLQIVILWNIIKYLILLQIHIL